MECYVRRHRKLKNNNNKERKSLPSFPNYNLILKTDSLSLKFCSVLWWRKYWSGSEEDVSIPEKLLCIYITLGILFNLLEPQFSHPQNEGVEYDDQYYGL